MIPAAGTLGRYIGWRFLTATLAVFVGIFALVTLVDYIEMMRRTSGTADVSAITVAKTSLYRVPQITERILPFCVLIAGMSSYLGLSRRLELVVARAAGMSAWQFVTPALLVAAMIGVFATTVYNPLAANLQEQAKLLEAEISGNVKSGLQAVGNSFWVRQRSVDGQSILRASSSQQQGVVLGTVTAFVYDTAGQFQQRIEARQAVLEPGFWRLTGARLYPIAAQPVERDVYLLSTNLTPQQVGETLATPETVPFWQLPQYIRLAEDAGLTAAGYRLQYQKLLSKPFLLAAMVLLACAFSLRFFRFGGVQKMVLGGVASGFLLYVFTKITDDLSKADLLHPVTAAWLPVLVGGMTGIVALLYLEDG